MLVCARITAAAPINSWTFLLRTVCIGIPGSVACRMAVPLFWYTLRPEESTSNCLLAHSLRHVQTFHEVGYVAQRLAIHVLQSGLGGPPRQLASTRFHALAASTDKVCLIAAPL
jgi:hypothetical protein